MRIWLQTYEEEDGFVETTLMGEWLVDGERYEHGVGMKGRVGFGDAAKISQAKSFLISWFDAIRAREAENAAA